MLKEFFEQNGLFTFPGVDPFDVVAKIIGVEANDVKRRLLKMAIWSLVDALSPEYTEWLSSEASAVDAEQLMIFRHKIINGFRLPSPRDRRESVLRRQIKPDALVSSERAWISPEHAQNLPDMTERPYYDPNVQYMCLDLDKTDDLDTYVFVWTNGAWNKESILFASVKR